MTAPSHINGRFAPGNKLAKGNPFNRKAQQLRAALFRSIDKDDVEEATQAILAKAKAGDVVAYKVLMDRLLGKPTIPVEVTNEGTPLGLTLSDIQIAIFTAIKDDPQAKLKVASAIQQLTHKAANDSGDS